MKTEKILFRNYSVESKVFLNRILVAFFIVLFLSIILVVDLYRLQIIHFNEYYILSNRNCTKAIPIPPNRGIIYDKNGIPLALNRTTYRLEIIPEKIDNLQKTIDILRSIIELTEEDIINFEKERKRSYSFSSIPIKIHLTELQQARFAINQFRFPGVKIKKYQYRYYPYGSTLSHVIGYVSKINNQDIMKLKKEDALSNYSFNDSIGKLGIEKYYENILHGKIGYEQIEVNNHGKIIRSIYKQLPQAGKNITLTLDLKLQQYIKKLLNGSRAAVVVVDPRDGGIQALVSNPSYDPNLFVNGISKKDYYNLLKNKDCPMINRVIQGIYPPASTVKPYISVSALTSGIINKNFSLFDPGWWKLPGSEKCYRDWKRFGHGYLDVTKALEESADTFFYQIAFDMGIDCLSEWMNKFGYGQYTGIDLFEESIGVMPTRAWKIKRFKKPWYRGDTISIGIGQGYWTATPVQMLKALMTLINNGLVHTPHLLKNTFDDNQLISYLQKESNQIGDPNSTSWKIAKNGMFGVANRSNGTACKSFSDAPYKVAVKSGTAQIYGLKMNEIYSAEKISEYLRDHKLMTAFAPYDKPTVAIVIILENGGLNQTIGTITRKILDYIFIN